MKTDEAVEALAALAQEHRLEIYRLLVRAGPSGLTAGRVASVLGLSRPALSFHLAQLERAGLLRSFRVQRNVHYVVEVEGMRRLLTFLTEDCCQGMPELCGDVVRLASCGDPSGRKRVMTDKTWNVLFICSGNSARSIIAESILAREGAGRFKAYSAGSKPRGAVDPYALDLLKNFDHRTAGLRSKSWDEFSGADAPKLDFVFTLCDIAANEPCPSWPGHPVTAHWGLPDPKLVEGSEAVRRAAYADAYRMLYNMVSILTNLPMDALDKLSLQRRLDQIGTSVSTKEAV